MPSRQPLNWNSLREHHGSREAAFEQLCAILAHRDDRFRTQPNFSYARNGRPDGGVECYWRSPTGQIHGYQAKYFLTSLGNSQWNQLGESLDQAIRKYPNLCGMTVCLPHDLPNSPHDGTTSARQKWEQWCRGKLEKYGVANPNLKIDLWDSHELTTRLAHTENHSLSNFFFDKQILETEELASRLREQIERAGRRYQPELHVPVELEAAFDWLTCSEQFRRSQVESIEAVRDLLKSEHLKVLSDNDPTFRDGLGQFEIELSHLMRTFGSPTVTACDERTWRVLTAWSRVKQLFFDGERDGWFKSSNPKVPEHNRLSRDRWSNASPSIRRIDEQMEVTSIAVEQSLGRICDNRILMISGSGGCGKTHLVCEMASKAAADRRPVVLVLGQRVQVRSLWNDILADAGYLGGRTEFLQALDVAGEVQGCRALLIIDAMNEAEDNHRWPEEVRALVSLISDYPNVAVVLTIRDSHRNQLWSSEDLDHKVSELSHYGFSGNPEAAVKRYCAHYNIAEPDIHALHPEFCNPLFLSIFCRAVAGDLQPPQAGATKFFRGDIDSFAKVFEVFLDRKDRDLVSRLQLDTDISTTPVRRAIYAIADRVAESPSLELEVAECKAILEQHLKSPKSIRNIVGIMESEGLLLRVPRRSEDGQGICETVQFAYDRMGSHFVVSRWLRDKKTAEEAKSIFASNGPLDRLSETGIVYGRAMSICEEVLMQWSGRFHSEVWDTMPGLFELSHWRIAFLNAVSISPESSFGSTTGKWIRKSLDSLRSDDYSLSKASRSEITELLLKRFSNHRLVMDIHLYLHDMDLAVRDAWWTSGISRARVRESRHGFVFWPIYRAGAPLANTQAVAYATSLAWLTTTSIPHLRACATKAIVGVLEGTVSSACEVLERFHKVNDPYVLQSVCLAVYGACVRSKDCEAISRVAKCVLRLWKSKNDWPVDLYVRHALSGIVECAHHRKPTWDVELSCVLPPYSSSWVDDVPSWDAINEKVRIAREVGCFGLPNIVSSCMPEAASGGMSGMYGDFGRYVVSSACGHFTTASDDRTSIHSRMPFPPDLAHRFIIQRVQQLGWKDELFEVFDREVSRNVDRHRNARERIGKKYQWIALSEFLARASDRFLLEDWRGSEKVASLYQYPRQLMHQFGVDTSLLRVADQDERFSSGPGWWADRRGGPLWSGPQGDDWLMCDDGIPDLKNVVVTVDPDSGRKWAVLGGFLSWEEVKPGCEVIEDEHKRKVWISIRSYAIKKSDIPRFIEWACKNDVEQPDLQELNDSMFGELFWSRSVRVEMAGATWDEIGPYMRFRDGDRKEVFSGIPLAARYGNESDPTFGTSLYAMCPSMWLAEQLQARAGPAEMCFENREGRLVCWNPSIAKGCADVALADPNDLGKCLEENELRLVWVIQGEKNVITGEWRSDRPRWPELRGVFWLEEGHVRGEQRIRVDESFTKHGASKVQSASPAPTSTVDPRAIADFVKIVNARTREANKPLGAGERRKVRRNRKEDNQNDG